MIKRLSILRIFESSWLLFDMEYLLQTGIFSSREHSFIIDTMMVVWVEAKTGSKILFPNNLIIAK